MDIIKISLAGNPNSGKTTLFNALTGSDQRVGNWPGVTVERKEGKLKNDANVIIQDLPGIYSLSPYTLEEVVTRDYLTTAAPDVIINIVDATNIERNLYLTTQLTELGVPVVIALNMIDEFRKNGDRINLPLLSELLGCPIVETAAVSNLGCRAVTEKAISLAGTSFTPVHKFSDATEKALTEIETLLDDINISKKRWYAVKLFERDSKITSALALDKDVFDKISAIISEREQAENESSEAIISMERYQWISAILDKCIEKSPSGSFTGDISNRIDSIVTNRYLALPIFASVMFMVYYLAITTVGSMGTDWVNDVLFGQWIPGAVNALLEKAGTADWLKGLIIDGMIGGVGAVLGFLPQMMVLFLCLTFLEDCGYMARVAFIMDRLLRSFGLSGKSFIPMLIGTGCSVPGIMASRTIENESDRRMTVLTTGFIPCGAKLPVIALISGAMFNNSAWITASSYFIGIAAVVVSGIILKKTRMFSGDPSPFIMELPHYHRPLISSLLRTTLQRSWSFVKKAATIILLSSVLIWVLQSFNWKLQMVDPEQSMLASLGNIIAPLFTPLGWGNWRAAVATITGLLAKENVVSTFGVLYGMAEVAEDGQEYWPLLRQDYSPLAAYSFLIFNLLCAPCFAAIGAIRREMASVRWTLFAISYQTMLAFITSFVIYQTGIFIQTGKFNYFTMFPVIIITTGVLYMLFRKNKHIGGKTLNALDVHENRMKK